MSQDKKETDQEVEKKTNEELNGKGQAVPVEQKTQQKQGYELQIKWNEEGFGMGGCVNNSVVAIYMLVTALKMVQDIEKEQQKKAYQDDKPRIVKASGAPFNRGSFGGKRRR